MVQFLAQCLGCQHNYVLLGVYIYNYTATLLRQWKTAGAFIYRQVKAWTSLGQNGICWDDTLYPVKSSFPVQACSLLCLSKIIVLYFPTIYTSLDSVFSHRVSIERHCVLQCILLNFIIVEKVASGLSWFDQGILILKKF